MRLRPRKIAGGDVRGDYGTRWDGRRRGGCGASVRVTEVTRVRLTGLAIRNGNEQSSWENRIEGGFWLTSFVSPIVKYFLISAPVDWAPDQYIRRFLLPTGEYVSCVLW